MPMPTQKPMNKEAIQFIAETWAKKISSDIKDRNMGHSLYENEIHNFISEFERHLLTLNGYKN